MLSCEGGLCTELIAEVGACEQASGRTADKRSQPTSIGQCANLLDAAVKYAKRHNVSHVCAHRGLAYVSSVKQS